VKEGTGINSLNKEEILMKTRKENIVEIETQDDWVGINL
jgi:hypothetical protein